MFQAASESRQQWVLCCYGKSQRHAWRIVWKQLSGQHPDDAWGELFNLWPRGSGLADSTETNTARLFSVFVPFHCEGIIMFMYLTYPRYFKQVSSASLRIRRYDLKYLNKLPFLSSWWKMWYQFYLFIIILFIMSCLKCEYSLMTHADSLFTFHFLCVWMTVWQVKDSLWPSDYTHLEM